MGNAGEVLTVVLQQSFDLTARSAPVSQRAEQTQRLPPLAFRCCCDLSSALRVRHLCHEECFLWAGAGADRSPFQPERKHPVDP